MYRKTKLIPREEMVNYLDIPDDIVVSPDIWRESDSVLRTVTSQIDSLGDLDRRTMDSDDIPPPLTDSEEDYELIEMIRNRGSMELWVKMREVLDAFPAGYLASLKRFEDERSLDAQETLDDIKGIEDTKSCEMSQYFDDEFKEKARKFFDEECSVFTPDDPSLKTLEEALKRVQSKGSSGISETDSIEDAWWRRTFTYSEFSISPPAEHLRRALARDIEYELPTRQPYNEERCKNWVEENFLRRMENL